MSFKSAVKLIPVFGPVATALARRVHQQRFSGSTEYWEQRYAEGGHSGAGSYNRLAQFKADFINDFVSRNDIRKVIEFGSGDGAQLELARYPSYIGVDVSETALDRTRRNFAGDPSKCFLHTSEVPAGTSAELVLSLDVIYHLVEDEAFGAYMRSLFGAASRFVIVYSSNEEADRTVPHVRHRRFTDWVFRHRPDYALKQHVPNAFPFDAGDPDNTSFADFYIFERR